ncbi:hypothetical protein VULLAG_LOCUS19994 [Vulpes lagopus]
MARSPARALGPGPSSPPTPTSGRYCPRAGSPAAPRGAQRFAASRADAVGPRGAAHCPAAASAMISAKPLPAPPPPPQAAAAMFSFLLPGPAAAASGSAPLPGFKRPEPRGTSSCCNCYRCAGDCESPPRRASAPASWKSLSPRRCRRLFRLPHGAKAAAILVRPSIAARGATQAAAAGAARWPHHLKRQERGREPRCGGGLGRRREAGAELPRWRERRERRRRNAGRAADGPGLPRAPCTHCRASAGRRVRRRALCSSSAPLGDSEGAWSPRPASARPPAARPASRGAGAAAASACRAASCGRRAPPPPPPPASCPARRERTVGEAPEPRRCLASSSGRNGKASGDGPRFARRGQPPAPEPPWGASAERTDGRRPGGAATPSPRRRRPPAPSPAPPRCKESTTRRGARSPVAVRYCAAALSSSQREL